MEAITPIARFYESEGIAVEKVVAIRHPNAFDIQAVEALPVKGVLAVLVDCDVGKMAVRFEVSGCWAKYDSATVRAGGSDRKAGTPWCIGSRKAVRGADHDDAMLERLAESMGADPLALLREDEVIRRAVRATRAAYNRRRGK